MKKLWLVLLLFGFAAAASPQAHAQVNLKIGPRLTIDVGDIEEIAIGGDIRAEALTLPVNFHGAFDYYFADEDITIFAVDLNAVYAFGIENQVFTPFVQAQFSVGGDFDRFGLTGGILFNL